MPNFLKTLVIFILGFVLVSYQVVGNAVPFLDKAIMGNGRLITKIRQLKPFENIVNKTNFYIYLKKSHKVYVKIHGEKNLIPLINTTVAGDTLTIEVKSNADLKTNKRLSIEVGLPKLKNLTNLGNSKIISRDIATQQLQIKNTAQGKIYFKNKINLKSIDASGQSTLEILNARSHALNILAKDNATIRINGKINLTAVVSNDNSVLHIAGISSEKLTISSNGRSDLSLAGNVTYLKISAAGAANIHNKKLKVKNADVQILGSGNIVLNVAQHLNATIAGSGNIVYIKKPKNITKQIYGSGTITEARLHMSY